MKEEKGISIADVMTAGAHGVPREVTEGVIDRLNYPNHEAIDFYHRYKNRYSVICRDGIQMLSNFHCPDTNLSAR
ncbi:hypothetical protein ACP0HM_06050 [Escherichia coli]